LAGAAVFSTAGDYSSSSAFPDGARRLRVDYFGIALVEVVDRSAADETEALKQPLRCEVGLIGGSEELLGRGIELGGPYQGRRQPAMAEVGMH
jgi:hypothetical protein